MLTSLQKIGATVLANRSDLDALVWPPEKFKVKKGRTPVYVELVLDLDAYKRSVSSGIELNEAANSALTVGNFRTEVDTEWLWDRGGVRMTGGPNSPSHYPGVRVQNTKNLHKALFGKDGGEPELLKWLGAAATPQFTDLMHQLKPFEESLGELLGGPEFKPAALKELPRLQSNEDPVFVYISLHLPGASEIVPLAQALDVSFQQLYLQAVSQTSNQSTKSVISHFTGKQSPGATEAAFAGRYNINKIFVTETSNYASGFNSKNYGYNYRLGATTVAELDAASEHLLAKHRVSIGGVPHVVVPAIIGKDITDDELTDLNAITDLAFGYEGMNGLKQALDINARQQRPYAIDFIAYDSNGNFFKIINWIHEVPRFHLDEVILTLAQVSRTFANQLPPNLYFNLYRAYQAIPVLTDGSARNEGVELLAMILERRAVPEPLLFAHFRELVLCHRYGRYRKYPNVYKPAGSDDAQVAERGYGNAVADYAVLRLALYNLNLLNAQTMHDTDRSDFFESVSPDVTTYFQQLNYSPRQQGVFFLGRALSQMAYEQFKKGNSKRIYQKINFNGMDFRSLRRLSADLAESGLAYKAREGGNDTVYDKLSWNLDRFNRVVSGEEETWRADSTELGKAVKPDAALYFLLAGANYKGKRKAKAQDGVEVDTLAANSDTVD